MEKTNRNGDNSVQRFRKKRESVIVEEEFTLTKEQSEKLFKVLCEDASKMAKAVLLTLPYKSKRIILDTQIINAPKTSD